MPQIEFDGQGTPNPTIALPPFGITDIPPTMLTFTENTQFSAEEYRALGFTHFEAWCVGAAGGRGGDSSENIPYVGRDMVQRPVPQDIWNLWLQNYDNTTLYSYGTTGGPRGDGWMTQREAQEWQNPNHLLTFVIWRDIPLFLDLIGMGGAGGGGGFQKVSGLLTDLPDLVGVAVGKAGSDAPRGQVHQLGDWTPTFLDTETVQPNFWTNYLNSYPPPNPTYSNPQPGGDGGPSIFGDGICQASGGKGGGPGMVWNGAKFIPAGYGGDGGLGDRVEAGGGGAGSHVEGQNGSDGIWHPELGIGGGGGGGKGGRESEYAPYDPRFGGAPIEIPHLATAGGQGSYSFADTSVYGQRQFRRGTSSSIATYVNGKVVFTPSNPALPLMLFPGGGGGARPAKNLKVGSYAPGYSPNGIVALRLTRIV